MSLLQILQNARLNNRRKNFHKNKDYFYWIGTFPLRNVKFYRERFKLSLFSVTFCFLHRIYSHHSTWLDVGYQNNIRGQMQMLKALCL